MRQGLAGLGMALAIAGCSPHAAPERAASETPADAPAARPAPLPEPELEQVLEPEPEPATSVESRLVGRFVSGSGRLLACDPFNCERARPFAQRAPRGEFELHLVLARFGAEERVARAWLRFSAAPVVRWAPALPEGGRGGSAYGVDSGTGAFIDAAAWHEHEARMRREPQAFAERLLREFDRNAAPARAWGLVRLEQGSVALFSSGFGDGGYASYWGYDAEGRPAALLTDFEVLPWGPRQAAEAQ